MKPDPSCKKLWRGLDELAKPAEFKERVQREFITPPSYNRRDFVKLMGASLALASLPACTRQPIEKIVPYARAPEQLIPGQPLFFATAMTVGGYATGLLVESHEGHPTKIEGNPAHPGSLGTTTILQQAAILNLYDPGRSQAILHHDQPAAWPDFIAAIIGRLETPGFGKGLRILTETITSPTLSAQIESLLRKYPGAKWHQYGPSNRDNVLEGSKLAFGEILEAQYHFDKAKVVLSLDSDFLDNHPDSIRHTREFAGWRRARPPQSEMNRFYAVECSPTVTGANADHRLPLKASDILTFARAIAAKLDPSLASSVAGLSVEQERWVTEVMADLVVNRGQGVVIAGECQPPVVHALAHRLNFLLGNWGNTVTFTPSAAARPVNQMDSLRELCTDLENNEVTGLLILGGNPVFNAPADFGFGDKMSKAQVRVHLSANVDETSDLCDWHIPENHFLESWGDVRAFDGTISLIQPLILPLYEGKSACEVMETLIGTMGRSDYEIVRDFWNRNNAGENFAGGWRDALRDGLILNTALKPRTPVLREFQVSAPGQKNENLEVVFRADPTIRGNEYSFNSWMHELPKPITNVVWDNPALISPAMAGREKLSNGDVIELEIAGRKARVAVWITPGQPDQSITLHHGCGSVRKGQAAEKVGFDINPLRSEKAFWQGQNVTLRKTGERHELVTTQTLHAIDSEERQIIRDGTWAEFQGNPDFVKNNSESPAETLFKPGEFQYDGYRWGMAIDLSACTGCNACTLACQSENNIPVVGKAEVARGRIMHWIRVDAYFRGPADNPEVNHQPVPCMHCENAPCELVCPVGATLHDKEGLNLQVYNRCVGTRYCSNNCPYKVRRFNFFEYADVKTPSLKPLWNPNVTVRGRGVMEKCTYCVQRISARRIGAEEAGRKIKDGELVTACQQVCPAQAIVFGDLGDPNSQVSKLKSHPLNFSMLGQLNTRPRTTYLAKLRNPNPRLSRA